MLWRAEATACTIRISRFASSESRPQIEENLQPRQLRALKAKRSHRSPRRAGDARHDKLRAVNLVAQINSNRSHRRRIADSKSDRVRKIIQLIRTIGDAKRGIRSAWWQRGILQRENRFWRVCPKRDAIQSAIDISSVVEDRPAQLRPDVRQPHREAKFLVEHQHSLASHRESRARVTWPGLIQRKSAQGCSSSPEKTFRQRDDLRSRPGWRRRPAALRRRWRRKSEGLGLGERLEYSYPDGTREAEPPFDRMVG